MLFAKGVRVNGQSVPRSDLRDGGGKRGQRLSAEDRTWHPFCIAHLMNVRLSIAALACLLGGCGNGSPGGGGGSGTDGGIGGFDCTGASPSFSKDVTPLFSSCSGSEICHGGGLVHPGGGTGGSSSPWPYDSLVNVPASRDVCSSAGVLAKPGSLDESYLMHKLTGVDMCPGTNRMPLGGSELPTGEIQTIADWICQGAKNN
jgi:hypothetical protein